MAESVDDGMRAEDDMGNGGFGERRLRDEIDSSSSDEVKVTCPAESNSSSSDDMDLLV